MRAPWHRVRAAAVQAAVQAANAGVPDLDQRRRNTATVAAHGRLLTADPTGVVHVCGIGLIPITVALAAVPVDDARYRLLLDPDDQAARDDEQLALAHLREVTRQAADAARTRGAEGPAPTPR